MTILGVNIAGLFFGDEGITKHVHHAQVLVGVILCSGLQRIFHRREQHRPIGPQVIQRARAYQRFQGTFVHPFRIDAAAEVEQIVERPVRVSRFHNRANRAFPDATYRAQAVHHPPFGIHGELVATDVDIRWRHRQLQVTTLFDQRHHLVQVVHLGGHHRRHERAWVVGLQPCGLVRHQRVGRRVRLVETVTGKLLHQVEDVARQVFVDAVGGTPFHETGALLGHLFGLFLTHGTAQHVGLP